MVTSLLPLKSPSNQRFFYLGYQSNQSNLFFENIYLYRLHIVIELLLRGEIILHTRIYIFLVTLVTLVTNVYKPLYISAFRGNQNLK